MKVAKRILPLDLQGFSHAFTRQKENQYANGFSPRYKNAGT